MRKRTFYLDGVYLNGYEKLLSIFTPGQQSYRGVFETMRVVNGRVEYVEEHLFRLSKGLKALKISCPVSLAAIKRVVRAVVRKNPSIALGRLRLMVFCEQGQTHTACMVLPYKPFNGRQYQKGLKACVIKTARPATSRYASVKSLDYAVFSNALKRAVSRGCDEAVLLNAKGYVCEASRGNIMILYQGQWLTPPLSSGCLNGIMRALVMGQMDVREKNITPAMLRLADVVVMTNSLAGLIKLVVGAKGS